jgi:bacterioferritin
MGKLAREYAQPSKALMAAVLRSYADEWFAHYNYFVVSLAVQGPSAASIAELLRERSARALERATRLAERVVQLGGEPPMKLIALTEHATDKPFKLPQSLDDVNGLLKAVLDAERTTIRLQRQIHSLSRERDPITAALAIDLMQEAERGEQQMQTLLGSEAPEMTGE